MLQPDHQGLTRLDSMRDETGEDYIAPGILRNDVDLVNDFMFVAFSPYSCVVRGVNVVGGSKYARFQSARNGNSKCSLFAMDDRYISSSR